MRRLRTCVLATMLVAVLCSAPAWGVGESTAVVFLIQPSIRSWAMGTACNGVCWGIDPDFWANPAMLGYYHGIHFDHGRTQLIPMLADDVYFTTDRIAIGEWGIGVVTVDRPIDGLGRTRLDYGTWTATGPGGEIIGEFNSYEDMGVIGVGINLIETTENLIRLTGRSSPAVSRFAEVSVGLASKEAYVFLAPATAQTPGGSGDVTTHDRGLLLRLTPYNSITEPGFFPGLDRAFDQLGGIRMDIAYGLSEQSYDKKTISFVDDETAPVAKISRKGFAFQFAVGLLRPLTQALETHGLGIVARSLTPSVGLVMAWDQNKQAWPAVDRPVEVSGWEVTLCNIYSIRNGRIDDDDGKIHGDTRGWGLGFNLAGIGGFRYDKATVPKAEDLGNEERSGYTLFVDPMGVYRGIKKLRSSGTTR